MGAGGAGGGGGACRRRGAAQVPGEPLQAGGQPRRRSGARCRRCWGTWRPRRRRRLQTPLGAPQSPASLPRSRCSWPQRRARPPRPPRPAAPPSAARSWRALRGASRPLRAAQQRQLLRSAAGAAALSPGPELVEAAVHFVADCAMPKAAGDAQHMIPARELLVEGKALLKEAAAASARRRRWRGPDAAAASGGGSGGGGGAEAGAAVAMLQDLAEFCDPFQKALAEGAPGGSGSGASTRGGGGRGSKASGGSGGGESRDERACAACGKRAAPGGPRLRHCSGCKELLGVRYCSVSREGPWAGAAGHGDAGVGRRSLASVCRSPITPPQTPHPPIAPDRLPAHGLKGGPRGGVQGRAAAGAGAGSTGQCASGSGRGASGGIRGGGGQHERRMRLGAHAPADHRSQQL
jgi:hypothetical protein